MIVIPCAFLSSAFGDFRTERSMLMEILPYIDVHLICPERKGHKGRKPSESIQRWIRSSDMVILLMGTTYSSKSRPGLSWAAKEIKYAIREKKRVFAYFREPYEEQEKLTPASKISGRSDDGFNVFSMYEAAFDKLMDQVEQSHPRFGEVLVYQQRLFENLSKSRKYGDSESRRAERFETINQLNTLALSTLGFSFNSLCVPIREVFSERFPKGTKPAKFVRLVEKHVSIIPQYEYGKRHQLAAMVIRDVERYAERLKQQQYSDGFE